MPRNSPQQTASPFPGPGNWIEPSYLNEPEPAPYVAPIDNSPIGTVMEELDKLDKLAYELTTPYEMRADKQRRPGELRPIVDRLRRALSLDREKQATTLQAVLNKLAE